MDDDTLDPVHEEAHTRGGTHFIISCPMCGGEFLVYTGGVYQPCPFCGAWEFDG